MSANIRIWSAFLVPLLLLTGCGVPAPQPSGTVDANGSVGVDPGVLPASIVDLAGVTSGDYNIVATKSSTTDEWEFTVRARRGLASDLTYDWNFGDSAIHTGLLQRYTFPGPGTYPVSVLARDLAGTAVFAITLDLEVLAGNQPPVASAGAEQTAAENQLVFLYGGGTFDPDGGTLSYLWTQTSGAPVQLLEPASATARFVTPFVNTDSSLTFSLSVSDGELSSSSSVTVFVLDRLAPASTGVTAVAGADQNVTEGDLVRLDGRASTGDATTAYVWTQTSGPAVVLSGAQTSMATFIAPAISTSSEQLQFSLTLSSSNRTDADGVMVIVGRAISATNPCVGDADGDGVLDCQDGCPADSAKTTPGTCGCGQADTDSDGDGVADCVDQCPGAPDVDADGDGVLNCMDGCPNDPEKISPLDCGCGIIDADANGNSITDCFESCPAGSNGDADGDGIADCVDGCPNDASKTAPGVCGCGVSDVDIDNDGVPDCSDQCPGAPDVDADGDGVLNCNDGCPNDAGKTTAGICGCGVPDTDTDGDGTLNCVEDCPNDANKTAPGLCGCGVPDTDANGNGIVDCNESSGSAQLAEDFDSYAPGADPTNWHDTNDNNSLAQNDSLFKTTSVGGAATFGTSSTLINIHSHYVAPGSSSWGSMTYTGRMRLSSTGGGIGVTFMSDYPNGQAYYRLRAFQGTSFHIAPHVTNITGGTKDSGVFPTANTWYSFHVDADDTGTRTEIRAKVWPAGSAEPALWQINCYDDSAGRLTSGTAGLWSMAAGNKDWDDLSVQLVNCDADTDGDGVADCQDGCPNDPAKTSAGVCGCDVSDVDSDGDGVPDCNDVCPGVADTDTDGDGTADCIDGCPNDAGKTTAGQCGCGVADTDSDNNGTPDCLEPAKLCVSVSSLNFGSTAPTASFDVWNCGGDTLSYTVADTGGWLSVSPTTGNSSGERDTLVATVNRTGLADGAYQAEIAVTPNIGAAITLFASMSVGVSGASPVPVLKVSRTSGKPPLALFFEATDSRDAAGNTINGAGLLNCSIDEYSWTFGDGASFKGFNAAHVFEPSGTLGPNGEPSGAGGSYTVTLTVRDANGNTASTTTQITVQPFTGTTYYVRADGNDANTGRGAGPGEAWRSYNKGFSSLNGTMQNGDRVLFRRGDTFTYTNPVILLGGGNNSDKLIAAFGSGASPVIQYTGAGSGSSFAPINTNSSNGTSIADLRLNCNGAGTRANGFAVLNSKDLLLLRVRIEDYKDANVISYPRGVNKTDKMFIVNSALTNASAGNIFYEGSRLAMLSNEVGPAVGSHNLYGSVLDRSLIQGNNFHDPHPTRHNIRIAGNHSTTLNVLVSDNIFDGGGTWLAIHMGISSDSWDLSQHVQNLLFERNTISNAGTAILLNSDYRDTVIRGNNFQGVFAFNIGGGNRIPDNSGNDGPKGVWFYNNQIAPPGGSWFTNSAPTPIDVFLWNNTVNGTLIPGTAP